MRSAKTQSRPGKAALMEAVCDLNRAREACYAAMPDDAITTDVLELGRLVARDVMRVLGASVVGLSNTQRAGLLMVISDEFIFGLQEKLRSI